MTKRRVNARVAAALQPLAQMTPSTVTDLAAALAQGLKITLHVEDDIARIVGGFLSPSTAVSQMAIAEAITGLHLLRQNSDRTNEELATELAEAFIESDAESDSNIESSQVKQNFLSVLDIRKLSASIKTWILTGDHENVYLSTRVFTDVRPVFDDDLSKPFMASIITHTIKVTYTSDGSQSDKYIVADTDDLRQLRETIDRALEKSEVISKRLTSYPEGFGDLIDGDKQDD